MNKLEIAIPKLGSLIVTHSLDGEIRGLKEWPAAERPPVAVVFWSFRIMVAIGMLMLLVAAWGLWLYIQGRLPDTKNFLRLCVLMGPTGFLAVLAGWFTAEVGRQPYTVYGLLRTVDSVSPVTANSVGMSLIVFVFAYSIVFCAGVYYISRLIIAGPAETPGSPEEMESDAVLSTRIEIGDYEHELRLSTDMTRK